jgi:uroporphyrinogen-III synthase
MVTVLVTRPRAASERLARELNRLSYDTIIEPLLTVEALPVRLPELGDVQAVMITSANTIQALESGDYDIQNFFGLPCFCVGAATGRAATELGFRHVHISAGGGEELARLIAKTLTDKKKSILHIAAKETDSKARETLEQGGLRVINWAVYAARPADAMSEAVRQRLGAGQIDAVVVFSQRTAQILCELLAQYKLEACCESLTAIGLSQAVCGTLRVLPWRKVSAASQPTETAVIESLKQLHPVS